MTRPFRFLLCASTVVLLGAGSLAAPSRLFGQELTGYSTFTDQNFANSARGTHRGVKAFHRAPIGAAYRGSIGAASRTTSAIGGIGGAADVGGPALTQWRFGREIGGAPDVGGPALNGGFGGIGGGPDVGGPALNGGLIGGPPRVGAPQFSGAPGFSSPRLP